MPWVHVDLASSERKGGLAHVPTEFTGFGVRYAVHLLGDPAFLARLTADDRTPASTIAAGRTTGTCTCATARSSPRCCRSRRGSLRARS